MKTFLIFQFFLMILLNGLYSQRLEHLSVHYSIKEITSFRNIFASNKVKTVTTVTNDRRDVYSIDIDGKILKMENPPNPIIYNYDSRNNLIAVVWPMADVTYIYDNNGNVIKEIGDEITYKFKYDGNNNLSAIDASESMIEALGTTSIQYKDGRLYEVSYDCMGEGNVNIFTRETYSYEDNNLVNIKIESVDCKTLKVKNANNITYEYNISGLPLREIYTEYEGNKTITEFNYEYHE